MAYTDSALDHRLSARFDVVRRRAGGTWETSLRTVLAEWGRIGCVGFGGPPSHIAMLRTLCVQRRVWLTSEDFEDAVVACNLLPGPSSTQLAIYCAWRVRGRAGALVGGLAFIIPGLVIILVLFAQFLGGSPPVWVVGVGGGAGAAVAAVAVQAGIGLVGPSWKRGRAASAVRWVVYAVVGGVAAAMAGSVLVLVLLLCGGAEMAVGADRHPRPSPLVLPLGSTFGTAVGGLGALAWTALKVGALAYGGGFVIIPLMQADAVDRYHWLSGAQFLNAVALGQITPGPVTQTVAAVGYAAAGLIGGLLAAAVAFAPSFVFILVGGHQFDRLRANASAQCFLRGAGPAAIGAIFGAAVPLARSLTEGWQFGILAAASIALLVLRRSVVSTLLAAGVIGALVAVL